MTNKPLLLNAAHFQTKPATNNECKGMTKPVKT